jgi:hypothetical protein
MILLLFFCSGATALVYEVIWSKYLSLMFGSTVQAQTVVLAVFMGGLALGNRLMGGFADRVRQPLLLYGYLEAAIGLYAFFFAPLFRLADAVFIFFGSRWLPHSGLLLLLKGGLSAPCRCWQPGCKAPRATPDVGPPDFIRPTAWARFAVPGWPAFIWSSPGAWLPPCN